MQFMTPISRAIEHDYGEHRGSGAYIEFAGQRLLITNEHVLENPERYHYTQQFHGCEDVLKLPIPAAAEPHPFDVAICPIGDERWQSRQHSAAVIPASRFASTHSPVERELLFFIGYSGERSQFQFGTLFSPGTPLLTQEPVPRVAGLHENQFALSFKPELAESVDGSTRGLPLPPGMSGSLVWNTRFVEYGMQSRPWSVQEAQVTGQLCRWPTNEPYVIATRVEAILAFLQRHMAPEPGVAGQ